MNILHICETLPGGIASYLEEAIPSQSEKYGKIIIIAPSNQITHIVSLYKYGNIFEYNRTGRNLRSFVNLYKAIKVCFAHNSFDVVFCHSSFSGFIGRLYKLANFLSSKAKYIYVPHGISMIMATNGKLLNYAYALVERIFCNLATHKILCVSNFEHKILVNSGFSKEKLTVIYNGVKNATPEPPTKKVHDEPLRILFVGRFDKEKGLYKLLLALKNVKRSYVLKVVGGETRKQDTPLEFPAQTIKLGWLERSEINAHYRWADVTVVPSEWEAFGLVAVEAMNNCCAVIAESVGGLNEVVIDGVTGHLVGGDINKYSEILSTTPISVFHELGANGRKVFLERFELNISSKSTLKLIADSCSKDGQ